MSQRHSPKSKIAGSAQSFAGSSAHNMTQKQLRIMKFGGTSVADASCIRQVVEIVRTASQQSDVVVVVSAMAGVTNGLIDVASHCAAGDWIKGAGLLAQLQWQHEQAVHALISSADKKKQLEQRITQLFDETRRLCQGTALLGELTRRVHDAVSGLGERLSAPLLSAALAESGIASESVEATELIIVDSYETAAEPLMDATREHCETRLRPILQRAAVPVVTGFIAATTEGVATTLGRGGSDYSATILAAAVAAGEVEIWTDVDGIFTADPHQVPNACHIPEISYREAAELAYFGAKVLHPKTLHALMHCGTPLWIRNTFSSQRTGTRITPMGPSSGDLAYAFAAANATLITIGGPALIRSREVMGRVVAATSRIHADLLQISQSSSHNDVCLIIPLAQTKSALDVLQHEFAHELEHEEASNLIVDSAVAMITVIGQNITGAAGRVFAALGRESINVILMSQGSDGKVSFVVEPKDLKRTLVTAHSELHPQSRRIQPSPVRNVDSAPIAYEALQSSAQAD
jgi:bifunctional aspartokinase / homoserine dehydrogenase 1